MDSFRANRVPAQSTQQLDAAQMLNAKLTDLRALVVDLKRIVKELPDELEAAERTHREATSTLKLARQYFHKAPPASQSQHRHNLEQLSNAISVAGEEITRHRGDLFTASDGADLRQNMNKSMQDAQSSLSNSNRIANETLQMGQSTLTQLASQSEQIKNTHNNVRAIDQQLDQANYLLRGIQSIGGAFSNLFRSVPQAPQPVSARAPLSQDQSQPPQPSSARGTRDTTAQHQYQQNTQQQTQTRQTTTTTAWPPTPASASQQHAELLSTQNPKSTPQSTAAAGGGGSFEDQQQQIQQHRQRVDQGLDQLHGTLLQMKGMGEAMGTEIEKQNKMLDELDGDLDRVDGRMKSTTKKIDKLLKR